MQISAEIRRWVYTITVKAKGNSQLKETFKKQVINNYYNNMLGELLRRYAGRIRTITDPGKVFTIKGQRSVEAVTSGELRRNITVTCAMRAARNVIHAILIFPVQNDSIIKNYGSSGALNANFNNGRINEEIFF